MKAVSKRSTEDGLELEDGELALPGGRALVVGPDGATPVLRLQGAPGSRLNRHPDPRIQAWLGVRYLMADRPGYGVWQAEGHFAPVVHEQEIVRELLGRA